MTVHYFLLYVHKNRKHYIKLDNAICKIEFKNITFWPKYYWIYYFHLQRNHTNLFIKVSFINSWCSSEGHSDFILSKRFVVGTHVTFVWWNLITEEAEVFVEAIRFSFHNITLLFQFSWTWNFQRIGMKLKYVLDF